MEEKKTNQRISFWSSIFGNTVLKGSNELIKKSFTLREEDIAYRVLGNMHNKHIDDIRVTLKKEKMIVEGTYTEPDKDRKHSQKYRTIIDLPQNVDTNNVSVILDQGYLDLRIPKYRMAR